MGPEKFEFLNNIFSLISILNNPIGYSLLNNIQYNYAVIITIACQLWMVVENWKKGTELGWPFGDTNSKENV